MAMVTMEMATETTTDNNQPAPALPTATSPTDCNDDGGDDNQQPLETDLAKRKANIKTEFAEMFKVGDRYEDTSIAHQKAQKLAINNGFTIARSGFSSRCSRFQEPTPKAKLEKTKWKNVGCCFRISYSPIEQPKKQPTAWDIACLPIGQQPLRMSAPKKKRGTKRKKEEKRKPVPVKITFVCFDHCEACEPGPQQLQMCIASSKNPVKEENKGTKYDAEQTLLVQEDEKPFSIESLTRENDLGPRKKPRYSEIMELCRVATSLYDSLGESEFFKSWLTLVIQDGKTRDKKGKQPLEEVMRTQLGLDVPECDIPVYHNQGTPMVSGVITSGIAHNNMKGRMD